MVVGGERDGTPPEGEEREERTEERLGETCKEVKLLDRCWWKKFKS